MCSWMSVCELWPLMCFAATSPGRTRSPLRTSLRSLQAVRNSRSLETDECQPADSQITQPASGMDCRFMFSTLKCVSFKHFHPALPIRQRSPNWSANVTWNDKKWKNKTLHFFLSQVRHLSERGQGAGLHYFPWETPQTGCPPWRECRGLSLPAPAGSLTLLKDTCLSMDVFLPHLTGRPRSLGAETCHPHEGERCHLVGPWQN